MEKQRGPDEDEGLPAADQHDDPEEDADQSPA